MAWYFLNLGIPSRSKLIWASFYYELWFDPFFLVYRNYFVNFHYVCYFNSRSNKTRWDYTINGFLDLTVWDFHPAGPEGALWILPSLLTLVFIQVMLMLFWSLYAFVSTDMYEIYLLGTRHVCYINFLVYMYVTIKDKQASVGGYNPKKALCEFCLCLTLVFIHVLLMLLWKSLRICFYHMYQIYVLAMTLHTCFSMFVHIIKKVFSYNEHYF